MVKYSGLKGRFYDRLEFVNSSKPSSNMQANFNGDMARPVRMDDALDEEGLYAFRIAEHYVPASLSTISSLFNQHQATGRLEKHLCRMCRA